MCQHLILIRSTAAPLLQVYGAREAFVTGTFGGLTPVVAVDGRRIGAGRRGPVTERLQQAYRELIEAEATQPSAIVDADICPRYA